MNSKEEIDCFINGKPFVPKIDHHNSINFLFWKFILDNCDEDIKKTKDTFIFYVLKISLIIILVLALMINASILFLKHYLKQIIIYLFKLVISILLLFFLNYYFN